MVANAQTEIIMENIDASTGEITEVPPPIFRHTRNANPLTRVRVAKHFHGPSLAKQAFASECDINNIMRKFEKSGLIEHLNTYQGQYGNFVAFEDYHASLNKILAADEAFAGIPSSIRKNFDNDPGQFLEFAQNPENLDQMIEMGLAPPKIPRDRYAPKEGQPPTKPPVTPEPPEKPEKPPSKEE